MVMIVKKKGRARTGGDAGAVGGGAFFCIRW